MDENARYNVATLGRLLRAAFTTATLWRFCEERAEFRALVAEFSPQHGLNEMVDRLTVYCRTRWLWDSLLRAIQAEYPRQYERFEAQLALDTPPEEILRQGKACWKEGLAMAKRGRMAEAVEYYDRAISLLPDGAAKALAYNSRGAARYHLQDLTGAMADYDRAVELDPENPIAYANRGIARKARQDPSGAIEDYDRAIALNPEHAEAYKYRGTARKKLGDLPGAMADYDRAIALNPRYAGAYKNRGHMRADQGDWAGAIADYDQAIELLPGYAEAHYGRGKAKQAQGDLVGAIDDYNRAIELDPANLAAYGDREVAQRALGEPDQGREQ